MNLRLVSWNIWSAKYIEDVIGFLRHANADIIALQEVIQDIDGRNNRAEMIGLAIGYHFAYGETGHFNIDGSLVSWGNAILSKHPILDREVYPLSKLETRTALRCSISAGSTIIQAFSTQLLHTHQQNSLEQDQQSEQLVKIVPKEKAVIMGDFNATPQTYPIQTVSRTFTNTNLSFNPTAFTTIEGCPDCSKGDTSLCLDYIFASKDFSVQSSRVDISQASDHLPITAVVEI